VSLESKSDFEVREQSLLCQVAEHRSKVIAAIDFGEDTGRRKIK